MRTWEVSSVTRGREPRAIDPIVLAFTADPVVRWTWPDPSTYLLAAPRLARAFGGRAFDHGSADTTPAGAALWLPPGVSPDDEALGQLMEETVDAPRQGDIFKVFEEMARYHPHEPHWYLPLIGVDPAHQGQGHGDALMRHALERCDRDHVSAYLESTNPRNVTLYLRHGFVSLGTIQVGSAPPLTPMLRAAR